MIKRSKTRRAVNKRTPLTEVLNKNRINIPSLPDIDPPLITRNIKEAGPDKPEEIFIDTSTLNRVSYKTSLYNFIPDENKPFDTHSETHITDTHEPSASFIADAAVDYFQLEHADDTLRKAKLRIFARDDEFCDDIPGANSRTYFIIDGRRPSVIEPIPKDISDPIEFFDKYGGTSEASRPYITDNVLITYGDLCNKNIKSLVGLPRESYTVLHNRETDKAAGINKYAELEISEPTLDMFIAPRGESDDFKAHEAMNTFSFVQLNSTRVSNAVCVNPKNAALFSVYGVLSVKPTKEYVNELKTVTIYIETTKEPILSPEDIETLPDTGWFLAGFKTVPCSEYGTPVSLSAYLHKGAYARLRVNLDTNMGSMNFFQLRTGAGFTNHFSNSFYGFSGVITD